MNANRMLPFKLFISGLLTNGALRVDAGPRQVVDANSIARLEMIGDSPLVVGPGAEITLGTPLDFDVAGYLAQDAIARTSIVDFSDQIQIFGWIVRFSCPLQSAQQSAFGVQISGDPGLRIAGAAPAMIQAYSGQYDGKQTGLGIFLYQRVINGQTYIQPAQYQNLGGGGTPAESNNPPQITVTSGNPDVTAQVWPLAVGTPEADDLLSMLELGSSYEDNDGGIERYLSDASSARVPRLYAVDVNQLGGRFPNLARRLNEMRLNS